jgi:phosphoribosylamine--glycine ligase
MAVSGGYPGEYSKHKVIQFSPPSEGPGEAVIIFHAGTKQQGNDVVTNGGRVLAVTSFGNNITDAVAKSTSALEKISFDGMYYRKDIGYEFS